MAESAPPSRHPQATQGSREGFTAACCVWHYLTTLPPSLHYSPPLRVLVTPGNTPGWAMSPNTHTHNQPLYPTPFSPNPPFTQIPASIQEPPKLTLPQFPYALTALDATLAAEWSAPAFAPYIAAFPPEHAASPSGLAAHVRDLMARDVKIAYLKSLQGYLWETGYAAGALKAPLFPDVAPRIAAWTAGEDKAKVMIYSSGSAPAQKLLFAHTDGNPSDLRPLLADYFDTVNAGPKTERASYERIAAAHPEVPSLDEWLFLSDNVAEVRAAKEAGMQAVVVDRPGNAVVGEEDRRVHRVVRSFEEL